MITAVVDTNVLVRGALSSNENGASRKIVDAFFAGRFLVLLSPETLEEIQRVLSQADVRARHASQTDEQIREFLSGLVIQGRVLEPMIRVPASVTRDVTDTKWVALAIAGNADYLVTLDRRHLRRLRKVGRTRILSPGAFLRALELRT